MSTIASYLEQLQAQFPAKSDWGENIETILSLESEFPVMPDTMKVDESRFHGCQSRIWLVLRLNKKTGLVEIASDSDSRIVRGLLAIASGYYHRRLPEEIVAHPPSLLRDTGLLGLLAPSRANGFYGVLVHIHGFAVKTLKKQGREE